MILEHIQNWQKTLIIWTHVFSFWTCMLTYFNISVKIFNTSIKILNTWTLLLEHFDLECIHILSVNWFLALRILVIICIQLVQRTSRFSREHMSLHLRSLHWLSVKQRVKFKWCLLIFKVLKLGLPPYFGPYFVPYTCKIATRRSAPSKNMLNRDIIPFNRNIYKSLYDTTLF